MIRRDARRKKNGSDVDQSLRCFATLGHKAGPVACERLLGHEVDAEQMQNESGCRLACSEKLERSAYHRDRRGNFVAVGYGLGELFGKSDLPDAELDRQVGRTRNLTHTCLETVENGAVDKIDRDDERRSNGHTTDHEQRATTQRGKLAETYLSKQAQHDGSSGGCMRLHRRAARLPDVDRLIEPSVDQVQDAMRACSE